MLAPGPHQKNPALRQTVKQTNKPIEQPTNKECKHYILLAEVIISCFGYFQL